MTDHTEPVVSVHGARHLSPEAREAVEAIIAVAKRHIAETPPDHDDGPTVQEAADADRRWEHEKHSE
jgi:hypothetical protein